jgi:hypothetical protein
MCSSCWGGARRLFGDAVRLGVDRVSPHIGAAFVGPGSVDVKDGWRSEEIDAGQMPRGLGDAPGLGEHHTREHDRLLLRDFREPDIGSNPCKFPTASAFSVHLHGEADHMVPVTHSTHTWAFQSSSSCREPAQTNQSICVFGVSCNL